MSQISITVTPLDIVIKVHQKIPEFAPHIQEKDFENRYTTKKKLIITAYLNSTAAGYLIGYEHEEKDSFYCWMLGVIPKFRRKGILTAMMNYLEQWAKKQGYNKIKIKTRNNRYEMLIYLAKKGFLITSVKQKQKIEENRIFLEKNI